MLYPNLSFFFFCHHLSVTGLSSDQESAQEYASTGVGLLAGSSILLLTVVWGTCVIIGKQKLKNDSGSDSTNSSCGGIKESLTGLLLVLSAELLVPYFPILKSTWFLDH